MLSMPKLLPMHSKPFLLPTNGMTSPHRNILNISFARMIFLIALRRRDLKLMLLLLNAILTHHLDAFLIFNFVDYY